MDNELEQQDYQEKPRRRKERTAPESKGFGDEPKVEEVEVEEVIPEPTPEPKPEPKPEVIVVPQTGHLEITEPEKVKKAPVVEAPKRVRKTKIIRPSRPTGDSIRGIRQR